MKRRSFLRQGAVAAAGAAVVAPSATLLSAGQPASRLRVNGSRVAPLGVSSAGDLTPYTPRPDKPWNERRAAHLLRRAGFGVTSEQLSAALQSTPGPLVQAMLADASLPAPPAAWVSQQPFAQLNNQAISQYYTWARDLQEWWFNLMQQPAGMLREKMVLFWHNHFVSEFPVVYVTQYIYMQNQLFRQFAFGDFRELAKQVTLDPAMLIYLDGAVNKAGNPNENYARELMELFTLGVGTFNDGTPHYTEQDIVQLARALTGWTVSGLGSQFMPARFDNGSKSIFNSQGNFGVGGKAPLDVIDLIFDRDDIDYNRKRAAIFICSKLYQYFVNHTPDMEIVAEMAKTLEQNNWKIGPVLGQLLTSEHFFDDNVIGSIIKSPVEFVAGAVHELKLKSPMDRNSVNTARPDTHDPITAMSNLSQQLFFPPNVKGWIGGHDWISSATVPQRIRYSKFWVEPITGSLAYNFDPNAFVRSLPTPNDVDSVLDALIALLLPLDIGSDVRDLLLGDLLAGGMKYEWKPDNDNRSRIRACLIRLMNLGEYQLM
jgi:uncharacterized protein (DUF1800 family)